MSMSKRDELVMSCVIVFLVANIQLWSLIFSPIAMVKKWHRRGFRYEFVMALKRYFDRETDTGK